MLKKYMIDLGYKEEEINIIRNTYPVIKCSEEYLKQSIEEHFKFFINYGYNKNQILKMTIERPHLFCYEISLLEEKLNYFENLLGNKKTVIKVTNNFPTIYSYDINSISSKLEELIEIGYKQDVIIKNIKNYPKLVGLSIEDNIKNMIKEFQEIGLTLPEILKITSKNMTIFGRNIESIKENIKTIENFGYTNKDVISMIKKHPAIINYSTTRLKQRMFDMYNLIGDKKAVNHIMKFTPSLFGDDMDKITDKKLFYDSIGLPDIFIKSPKDMIQGISKSYARYRYYQSIGIDISAIENGYKLLFLGEQKFETRYKIKSSDLILKYDVYQYMNEIKSKSRT